MIDEDKKTESRDEAASPSDTSEKVPTKEQSPEKRIAFGMKRWQTVTLLLVLVAVIISLAFDSGLGTPSSFGIGSFFLLCPLGGIEAMIASRSFIPVGFISLLVLLIIALIFGRAWCAWGCPAPRIRHFFRRDPKARVPHGDSDGVVCTPVRETWNLIGSLRHIIHDPRTWALFCVIVATIFAGIPIFCLICPIGLTFGTVGSLWHLIVDKQMTFSVLVFPAALVIELVLCKIWCLRICPIAGLLNIFGQFAVLFRPRVKDSTCLQTSEGKVCSVCTIACPEQIDLHARDATQQLGTCMRCGACARSCPTSSISFKVKPEKSGEENEEISL